MIENLECRRFRNRIDAFIDNELSSSEREEMLRHAQQCPECGKLLSEYQDMLSLMQKMDEETEIPQEAAQAWRSAVRDEAEHTRRSASRGWVRALVSVAAAFVLLLGVTGLYRSGVGLPSLGTKGADSYYESYEEGYYYDSYDTGAVMTMRSTAMEDSAAGAATLSNTARTVVMESDGAANTLQTSEAAQERKPMIVRSASRTMQSTAFDEDCASIDTLVYDYQGWYGYRSLTGKAYEEGGTGRSLELSIRIPTETMDDFLTDLKQIGATVRMTDSAEDISRDYYDSQTRLEGLHAQHARLVGLISDAADLSDLIALEDKLYEVQSEIDYLEGSLRDMDSRAQYSNISVSLSEVREYSEPEYVEETLVERIKNGFRDSIDWVVGFLEDMVVAVVAFAPVLVIAVPLLVILMLIIRAIRKKRRR